VIDAGYLFICVKSLNLVHHGTGRLYHEQGQDQEGRRVCCCS